MTTINAVGFSYDGFELAEPGTTFIPLPWLPVVHYPTPIPVVLNGVPLDLSLPWDLTYFQEHWQRRYDPELQGDPVPEPSSLSLVLAALVALAAWRRR